MLISSSCITLDSFMMNSNGIENFLRNCNITDFQLIIQQFFKMLGYTCSEFACRISNDQLNGRLSNLEQIFKRKSVELCAIISQSLPHCIIICKWLINLSAVESIKGLKSYRIFQTPSFFHYTFTQLQ